MNGLEGRVCSFHYEYDFSKDGGAIGDITLRGQYLPSGAVITGGFIDVQTAAASDGSATIAIAQESAGDLYAATDLVDGESAADMGVTGLLDVVPDGTAANMIKTTAAGLPIMTIGTDELTAGKFVLVLHFDITD